MPDCAVDVLERAVAAIAKQAMPRLPRDRRIGERPAIDQEDVDPAVVVVVEEQPAGADGLDQVLVGTRAVDVTEVDAGGAADVREGTSFPGFTALAGDDPTAQQDDQSWRRQRRRTGTPAVHRAPLRLPVPCSARVYMARRVRRRQDARRSRTDPRVAVDERIGTEADGGSYSSIAISILPAAASVAASCT